MSRTRAFVQVDVFSANSYLGNPLAVVIDGKGIDDDTMARVARWTGLSETTFLLPPADPAADYRVRIFTQRGEIPFAGHPTLGSAHAWLENGGVPGRADRVVQECGAGLVEISRSGGTLAFAAPPVQRSGDLDRDYLAQLVAALNIDARQVVGYQWVDNGPGWAAIRLATAAEVLALEPDFSTIPDANVGVVGAYPIGAEHAFELRAFVPGAGDFEDPGTGSVNASVAQWLIRTGVAPASYKVSQGTRLGRTGEISVRADDDGTVWIGGITTTCFRGDAII